MPYKTRTRTVHYALITAIGIIFIIPAFLSKLYSGHNVLTHLLWTKHFADQFWTGDLYPRWLMDMNSGLGSPVFFFYFPVPYFFTCVFHLPFLDLDSSGWLQLGLSSTMALVLSGIGAYLWLGKLVDRNSAAITAVLYMIMPYHLLVDLYMRFAFSEFWSFVWMPLLLYCSHLIVENKRMATTFYAITYSLLIMTHLPTALLFSPVAFIYTVFLGKRFFWVELISKLSLANILGLGLASIYLIPALTTQSNISMGIMTDGLYNFTKNFLFSSLQLQPLISHDYLLYLSIASVSMFSVSILSYFLISKEDDNKRKQRNFWLLVSVFSTFMMFEISTFLWNSIPLLQRIQFPYRINTVLTIAVTALVALAISGPGKPPSLAKKFVIVLISSFFLSQTIITAVTVYDRATGEWGQDKKEEIKKELMASPEVGEYRPRWAAQSLFTIDEPNRGPSALMEGGTAEVILWQPRRIVIKTVAEMSSFLEVQHLFYPGWSATLDGHNDGGLRVRASHPEGLLEVSVPQGHHEVELTLERQPSERTGIAISAVSAFIVLLIVSKHLIMESRRHDA